MLALLIVSIAILAYYVQEKVYEKYWDKNLSVTIDFSKEAVAANEEIRLFEVIENRKKLPLPMLTVKFETAKTLKALDQKNSSVTDFYYRNDIFTMEPMRKKTREIPMLCTKRGFFQIHDITLISSNLFLKNEQFGERTSKATLYVYPAKLQNQDHNRLLSRITGEVLAKRHQEEDPFEFRGIREYCVTDEMRKINWKASAKTGDLKVNMKNYTSLRAIRLFVNLEDTGILKHENADEYAISVAATLAEECLKNGMRLLVETNGKDLLSGNRVMVGENGGVHQLTKVLRAFSRIDCENTCPFAESLGDLLLENTKDVYTILVTTEIREDLIELIESFLKTKMEFRILHICMPDTEEVILAKTWGRIYQRLETDR